MHLFYVKIKTNIERDYMIYVIASFHFYLKYFVRVLNIKINMKIIFFHNVYICINIYTMHSQRYMEDLCITFSCIHATR